MGKRLNELTHFFYSNSKLMIEINSHPYDYLLIVWQMWQCQSENAKCAPQQRQKANNKIKEHKRWGRFMEKIRYDRKGNYKINMQWKEKVEKMWRKKHRNGRPWTIFVCIAMQVCVSSAHSPNIVKIDDDCFRLALVAEAFAGDSFRQMIFFSLFCDNENILHVSMLTQMDPTTTWKKKITQSFSMWARSAWHHLQRVKNHWKRTRANLGNSIFRHRKWFQMFLWIELRSFGFRSATHFQFYHLRFSQFSFTQNDTFSFFAHLVPSPHP